MAKKRLVILIKSNPFGWKTFEALRMSVGLALDHEVIVIFIKNGVYALTDWKPKLIGVEPLDKSIESLGMLNAKIYVEEEGIRERGIKLKDWNTKIEILPYDELVEIINSAEVILSW